MSVEQKGTSMTEGRGLLTEREREAIQGESSDSYRYKTRTYLRRRLDKLEVDAELLAEHEPELYDRLLDAVDARAVDVSGDDAADRATGDPAAAVDAAEHEPAVGDGPDHNTRVLVERVVDDVAGSWEDDDRLADRKAAAAAVLTHAVESGDHVGRGDAVEQFHDEHPVDGQDTETWWRQNGREALSAVGTYSNGQRGYAVDVADLRDYLED